MPSKSARAIQQKTEEALPVQVVEERLAVTLRTMNGYEYHLDLPRSVIAGILDPDVDDAFLEVPCQVASTRRYIHTSNIKEIDVKGF